MKEQPEVRVERGPVTQNEAFAIGMAKLLEREGKTIAAAELRRLSAVEAQRDALLEALKRMASIIDEMGDMPDGFIHPSPWQTLKCEEALTQARAAIKAVEENK